MRLTRNHNESFEAQSNYLLTFGGGILAIHEVTCSRYIFDFVRVHTNLAPQTIVHDDIREHFRALKTRDAEIKRFAL